MARKSRIASASSSSKPRKRGRSAIPEAFRVVSSATVTGSAADVKVPILVLCGEWLKAIGFPIGSAAYLTDFSEVPESSLEQLRDLDILFLDALRHQPHPTHSTVANSLQIVERLKPMRTFFTHIAHDLPHAATNAALPPDVRLAYDGLKLEFEI